MDFIITGFLTIVETGANTVGSIGYTGLETIGIVSSGPSQQNINNEKKYKRLRREFNIAAQREANSKKIKEEKYRREQQNAQRRIEAAKKAKEKAEAQKIEIAKILSPGLKNTELEKFIIENKKVIDIIIELNNFLENILSNNKISTKCFQIDEKLVKNLANVLNKNNIILLKKIRYFEEAYKIVTGIIRIPGSLVGTRSFKNNNINSKNYNKLIKKESIALQICMQIAIKYGADQQKIHFNNACPKNS